MLKGARKNSYYPQISNFYADTWCTNTNNKSEELVGLFFNTLRENYYWHRFIYTTNALKKFKVYNNFRYTECLHTCQKKKKKKSSLSTKKFPDADDFTGELYPILKE